MSNHKITTSEKLLEKQLAEFLWFTDEALGLWQRDSLSLGHPTTLNLV